MSDWNDALEAAAKLCEERAERYRREFTESDAPEEETDLIVSSGMATNCAYTIRELKR